jgi:hypothetical protein
MTEMKTYKHDVPYWKQGKESVRDIYPLDLCPSGPWDDEPDKAQWVDPATDLDCLIVRGPMGALCGYVGVSETHPLFGQDYEKPDVRVHGGLTFAARCRPDDKGEAYGICHVPEPGRPDEVWWFGFDCAHAWDLAPGMAWSSASLGYGRGEDVYRDFDYVQNEVTQLAAQLKEAS